MNPSSEVGKAGYHDVVTAEQSGNFGSKVLVTGATGFLGRAVVEELRAADVEIIALGQHLGAEADLPNFVRVNLRDQQLPRGIFSGVSAVIHCAGLAHQFGRKAGDGSQFFEVNRDGAVRIAEAAADAGVRKFVLVSSVSVYGQCNPRKTEDDECQPANCYAESKLAGERAVLDATKHSSMQVVILRLATLYGANDPGNVGRLARALRKPWALLVGSGDNQKSLLHVRDAARACVLAASRQLPINSPRVFNVAGDVLRMHDVVSAICVAHGRRIPPAIPSAAMAQASGLARRFPGLRGVAGHFHRTLQKWLSDDAVCDRKFREWYEFAPAVSLGEGMSELCQAVGKRPARDSAKRCFDIVVALALALVLSLPILAIAVLVRLTSRGPALYWSNRVGRNNRIFRMAKFRSMRTDAPQVATHLLQNSDDWITPIGKLMRKTSLDELPQLWNVLRGDMSFVGPRPALFNQYDLVATRTCLDVDQLLPGVTGWAQINGRDELTINEKVFYDREYVSRKSLRFDCKVMVLTVWKGLAGAGVKQADHSDVEESWLVLSEGHERQFLVSEPELAAVSLAIANLGGRESGFGITSLRSCDAIVSLEQHASKNSILVSSDRKDYAASSLCSVTFQVPTENKNSTIRARTIDLSDVLGRVFTATKNASCAQVD